MQTTRLWRWAGAVLVSLALSLASRAASAQAGNNTREVMSDLASSDIGKVRHAIGELESMGGPAAVKALIGLVRRGAPGPALVPAIRAIGTLRRLESMDILIECTRHRRSDARVAAAEGLSNLRGVRVVNTLHALVSDPDPDVRGAAAAALATAGTRASVPLLFRALERQVDEAALAIGKLGNGEDVAKLAGYLGRMPLPALLPGMEAVLLRSDLAAQARVEVVRKLGALQTPEVREFLERVQLAVPTAAVRDAMMAEAGRIAG